VTTTALAGLGAFLSGAASVLGALYAIRAMRKRLERECEERLELFRAGLERGAQLKGGRDQEPPP